MLKARARKRKAYWTASIVALSYLWLYIRSKLFGRRYWLKRIRKKNAKNAHRLKRTMMELQGLFIKAGQLISTLSNVLPEEFREPLEQLQDHAPPHSYEAISRAIQRELGHPIEEIFERFDRTPMAAASIGQAHRARLNGQEVVVKIQHPEIEELLQLDLSIIEHLVTLFARFMKIKGIEHLYRQVAQMIEEELDYVQEAASMQLVKQSLAHEPNIYVPKVFTAYSSRRVLTIEYCDGVKISDVDQIDAWKLNRYAITETLVHAYCHMILVEGFYHADPHPGNLLINEAGQIILLDFGAVSRISENMREGIPRLLQYGLQQNVDGIVMTLKKLGFISNDGNTVEVALKIAEDIREFADNELNLETLDINQLSPEQVKRAFEIMNIKQMSKIVQIPKDWVLLNRAVVLVGGVVFTLTPSWNPVETLKPYLENQLLGGKAGLARLALDEAKHQLTAAIALPSELRRFLKRATHGRLEVGLRDDPQAAQQILAHTGQQLVWLFAFAIGLYFYLAVERVAADPSWTLFFQIFSIVSFVAFVWTYFRRHTQF